MKKFFLTALSVATVNGQLMPPEIPAEDAAVIDRQAGKMYEALRPVTQEARKVVFPVFAGKKHIAYGISLGNDRLLAKASDVVPQVGLIAANALNQAVKLEVEGIYYEHDLVVLKARGLDAPAARWADAEDLTEGDFLTAVRPNGQIAALGVLSVDERSLKKSEQGFLGVQSNRFRKSKRGVLVSQVVPGSSAHRAGILPGDLLLKVQGEPVNGSYELSTKLRRMKAGEKPEMIVERNGQEFKVVPTLHGWQEEQAETRRINRMDAMSGSQSMVRGNFDSVLQSDMELEANDVGLPVVDLRGRLVGMVIARAGRISTLILPGDELQSILKEEPQPVRIQRRADPRMNERQQLIEELQRKRREIRELERRLRGR